MRDALASQMGTKAHSFCTLTLCGKGEKLTDLIDRLYKCFRALRQHPLWTNAVRGGGAFLEVKWIDKFGRWHPHLHCIIDADFMDQGHLSTAWHSITRDSFIVDIRRVRDIKGQQRYVTKYASKPLNTSFSTSPHLLDEPYRPSRAGDCALRSARGTERLLTRWTRMYWMKRSRKSANGKHRQSLRTPRRCVRRRCRRPGRYGRRPSVRTREPLHRRPQRVTTWQNGMAPYL